MIDFQKMHLIDQQVVIFILAMHCRRFVYCLITWVFHILCPQNYWKFIRLFIRYADYIFLQ
jgi:hypothetical protein